MCTVPLFYRSILRNRKFNNITNIYVVTLFTIINYKWRLIFFFKLKMNLVLMTALAVPLRHQYDTQVNTHTKFDSPIVIYSIFNTKISLYNEPNWIWYTCKWLFFVSSDFLCGEYFFRSNFPKMSICQDDDKMMRLHYKSIIIIIMICACVCVCACN